MGNKIKVVSKSDVSVVKDYLTSSISILKGIEPKSSSSFTSEMKQRLKYIDECADLIGGNVKKISRKIDNAYDRIKQQWDKEENNLKQALASGNLKAANSALKTLIGAYGTKKASKIAKNLIKKIGKSGTYKVTNGVISKIKGDTSDKKTGAKTKKKNSVGVLPQVGGAADMATKKLDAAKRSEKDLADMATRKLDAAKPSGKDLDEMKHSNGVKRAEEIYKQRTQTKAEQAEIYKKGNQKLSEVNMNDPDAERQIEMIKKETETNIQDSEYHLDSKLKDIDAKYGDNYEKLDFSQIDAEGSKNESLRYNIMMEQEQVSVKKEAQAQFNTTLQSKLEQAQSSSTKTNVTPIQQSTQSSTTSATAVAKPVESSYSVEGIPANSTSSQSVQTQNNVSSVQSGGNNNTSNSTRTIAPAVQATTSTSSTPNNSKTVISTATNPQKSSSSTSSIGQKPKVTVIDDENYTSGKSSSSGAGVIIPAVLGVGALGTAGVVGARYIKNKKSNEDIDNNYDDEDNSEYFDDESDSYTGPEGSSYQDTDNMDAYDESDNYINDISDQNVSSDDSYTDMDDYDGSDDDFSEDEVLNSIN